MRELVVVSRELKSVNKDSALEVVKFNFGIIEGRFTVTTLSHFHIYHVYWNGFATWSDGIEWWNNDTTFKSEDEFVQAFKNKFGIEIPTVK